MKNDILLQSMQTACRRIPPLWPLKNFVAVNPFLGMADMPFAGAAGLMQRVGHGDILMPPSYYLKRLETGDIQDEDIIKACQQLERDGALKGLPEYDHRNVDGLVRYLKMSEGGQGQDPVLTVADWRDKNEGTAWSAFVVEEVSKWCSVYFDEGQSSWRMPWRGQSFYKAWREAARFDANPGLMGMGDFRKIVDGLSEDPMETIQMIMGILEVPEAGMTDFLHRQIMSVGGWGGYIQYRVRQAGMNGQEDTSLVEFLALRLVYDLVLFKGIKGKGWAQWKTQVAGMDAPQKMIPEASILCRLLAQQTLENSFQRRLFKGMAGCLGRQEETMSARKTLQAIFCIDVRSEIYRRNLEGRSAEIETIGFAGFFGIAVEYLPMGRRHGNVQCPVLLNPALTIRETLQDSSPGQDESMHRRLVFGQRIGAAWNAFKTSAVSCFPFVETVGLAYGVGLVQDSLRLHTSEKPGTCCGKPSTPQVSLVRKGHHHGHAHGFDTGIDDESKINMAAGALRNMGLTSGFARFVLICGHGSQTRNNPYGSGLDCGACGGHAGDVNARVAVALFNDLDVRVGLRKIDIHIPDDTVFLAGLHNTTTDDVHLFEDEVTQSADRALLETVRGWLDRASAVTRRERATRLGMQDQISHPRFDEKIRQRSKDWAQVRPEWGLAGNAAFIAAPRERTRGLNLQGRVFLHNYDVNLDPSGSVLELILCAPVVVASWINLQYYASTVNNRLFGSGNKVLHNVVGVLGVWQGNAGDLQTGLPMQSVHDGTRWMHEPLRLSVIIEASTESINVVLKKHPEVRALMDHGWLHLFAIKPGGGECFRYAGGYEWQSEEMDNAPADAAGVSEGASALAMV
ncbi:MAG: DUF2309 domain-containing protein [Verrucomicrobiota bacterium]|nr:DUF2309 domain-containing protein [Verrucomicrobiota bacterium]